MAHLIEKETIARANGALLQAVIFGGLAACAVGALIYDIGRLMAVW